MTSEDDAQTRLRVGGWLPPYQSCPAGTGPHARPLVYRAYPAAAVDTFDESRPATDHERRGAVLVFLAAVAALLLIGVAITQLGGKPAAGPEVRLPSAPFLPPPSFGFAPPDAGEQSTAPTPTWTPSREPLGAGRRDRAPVRAAAATTTTPARPGSTHRPPSAPTRPPTAPTRPPTAPPAALTLRPGSPISLELASAAGHRVRHRDFLGRADRIGAQSSALARADARFVVRRGLADRDCVSFESSNYPGRFLRHRNFKIRLDRVDGSRLFTQDATFCPETHRSGVVMLRSRNYPDRFLTESRSRLVLTPATTGTATKFVVRPPL